MRASLLQRGVELEERDFFEDSLTEAELRRLLAGRSPSDYFSWKSPSFKKMGIERSELEGDELLRMMVHEPRLIRRPLVSVGEKLFVGTDKEALADAFGPAPG